MFPIDCDEIHVNIYLECNGDILKKIIEINKKFSEIWPGKVGV